MIKYYSGNYSLKFGHPMVIISAEEKEKEFYAEKYIFFDSNDGMTFLPIKVNHPKFDNQSLDGFIQSELDITKDDIYHKILFKKFGDQYPNLIMDFSINLFETQQSILSILKEKCSEHLRTITYKTNSKTLKELINLYLSFRVIREEF